MGQQQSLQGLLSASAEAVTAALMQAFADVDHSAALVGGMLSAAGPVSTLPRNAKEFAALLEDRSSIKIPVASSSLPELRRALSPRLLRVLRPVRGSHSAAAKFSSIICDQPYRSGSYKVRTKASTMLGMQMLFNTVRDLLGSYSWDGVVPEIKLNLNSHGSRPLPTMSIVSNRCTLMIGEDQEEGRLRDAASNIRFYAYPRLPAVQYGRVPGIPAYAASGTKLQFMYIQTDGQVLAAGQVLDLSTHAGRLSALCATIHCYRLMVSMTQALPPLLSRAELWLVQRRDELFDVDITLTPLGAIKTIQRFKSFSQELGVTQNSLKAAYKAAADAAQQQRDRGQKPFLVSAVNPPEFSRRGFEVHTTPLGYRRGIATEKDVKRLASSCLRAASVLHAAGVVHTDLQLANTVWLDEEHCMVIDLELCRMADTPLPSDVPPLTSWDDNTLEVCGDDKFFTPASDLYQIGRLLQQLWMGRLQQSQLARQFVEMLLGKKSLTNPDHPLTADEALRHEWLASEGAA